MLLDYARFGWLAAPEGSRSQHPFAVVCLAWLAARSDALFPGLGATLRAGDLADRASRQPKQLEVGRRGCL